ncbi:MAG: hypothetical protein E6J90_08970 [Deltaproteobacteria bacterium]|nr:MAG: hypothetical protein E6J90_08970 [Deltaproteobacteria bacterium]
MEREALQRAIAGDLGMERQRRGHLVGQLRAMQATLAILAGETMSVVAEAETLYDISAEWVDEASFEDCRRTLDELLPGRGPLVERLAAGKAAAQVAVEPNAPALAEIVRELGRRARDRFALPRGESLEIRLTQGRPWSAYNWYLGELRSRIEINVDRPIDILRLVHLVAHEGYPGHHTDLAIKEARLVRRRGWLEHAVTLLESPVCVVAEGIATRGLDALLSRDELFAWCAAEVFPRAGLSGLDPRREHAIEAACQKLLGVRDNAALLRHVERAADHDVMAYLRHHGLCTEQAAAQALRFIDSARSYVFTYRQGGALVDALLAAEPAPACWFARLLEEPVTPSQLRAWIRDRSQGAAPDRGAAHRGAAR